MKALIIILTIPLFVIPAYARYGGGSGELKDPFLIYTAEQMNEIGLHEDDWDKHFKLMADISLAAYKRTDFNIIGKKAIFVGRKSVGYDKPFTGVFDGNSHTISNFTYDCNAMDEVAMFRYVMDPNAEIRDLGLIDPNVRAETGDDVGSLVGFLGNGTVTNCYVEGSSVKAMGNVGGLVGSSNCGMISACHSKASVSGDSRVGGLVGENHGTITNCHSTGNISGHWRGIGGLVGRNDGKGAIRNCASNGRVSGDQEVGGLVGRNVANIAIITNCYATSSVSGKGSVGGLVGGNAIVAIVCAWDPSPGPRPRAYAIASITEGSGVAIWNCYATGSVVGDEWVGGMVGNGQNELVAASFWDIQTSGQTTSAGGEGKTTVKMQTASTFLEAGWDFIDETANGTEDIWWLLEGQCYPRLLWQYGQAFSPYPQDGDVDVPQPLILSWFPGGSTMQHDVYFGEYEQEVANATIDNPEIYRGRQATEVTTYDPGSLELNKIYYWRIDEVNEAESNSPWKGDVWSFITGNFIVVDDFESYDGVNPIWWVWKDGLGAVEPYYPGNGTGSAVCEINIDNWIKTIAHSGFQSMTYYYDNNKEGFAKYSEAIKTLSYPRDWIKGGVTTLTLWFHGDRFINAPEPMYIAIANGTGEPAVVYHNDPNAAWIDTWTEWIIPLQTFTDQGIDLTDVNSIAIGFGDRNNPQPGGNGTMYFDDIRRYPLVP